MKQANQSGKDPTPLQEVMMQNGKESAYKFSEEMAGSVVDAIRS